VQSVFHFFSPPQFSAGPERAGFFWRSLNDRSCVVGLFSGRAALSKLASARFSRDTRTPSLSLFPIVASGAPRISYSKPCTGTGAIPRGIERTVQPNLSIVYREPPSFHSADTAYVLARLDFALP